MKEPYYKFRLLTTDGAPEFPTRRDAQDAAPALVESTGASVMLEQWDAKHVMDELNKGWAMLEVFYHPFDPRGRSKG